MRLDNNTVLCDVWASIIPPDTSLCYIRPGGYRGWGKAGFFFSMDEDNLEIRREIFLYLKPSFEILLFYLICLSGIWH